MLAKNQLCLAQHPDRATGLDSPRNREVPDPEDSCFSTVTHSQPVPTAQPSTGYPPTNSEQRRRPSRAPDQAGLPCGAVPLRTAIP
eukprot:scaffold76046_cov73-Phaeocystis_antarctica.AAC.4